MTRRRVRRVAFVATAAIAAALLPAGARAQGMPQLDFTTPLTTSQVVWGVLLFALLYVLLTRWALPRVATVLNERAAAVEADLETARAAKAQADAAVAEMTEAVAHARAEAQAEIGQAVDRAKQAAAAQAAVLNERLERQLLAAETQITAARRAAMGALREVATDTATTVVQRLTGRAPDPRTVAGAVGQVLAGRAG